MLARTTVEHYKRINDHFAREEKLHFCVKFIVNAAIHNGG